MLGEFQDENMELLEEKSDPDAPSGNIPKNEPRRNTKKDLIAKIKTLCADHKVPLNESDTALQRTSKVGLQKLLAKKTEEVEDQSVELEESVEINERETIEIEA